LNAGNRPVIFGKPELQSTLSLGEESPFQLMVTIGQKGRLGIVTFATSPLNS
jgi:hypothetical protein